MAPRFKFLLSRSRMAPKFTPLGTHQITQIILYFSCWGLFLVPGYADVDAGTDTLTQGQQLINGVYLTSANNYFRLQFFSLGSPSSKYLGIFYHKPYWIKYSAAAAAAIVDRPVWIGNRDTPVPNLFVMLVIDTVDGLLKISYRGGNTTVSNSTPITSKNTSATILDDGNLVLRMTNGDGSINRTLWQSFDYPTDTLLPGMKLGINFKTGQKWSLTSWVSDQVPASGSFALGVDPNGSSPLVVWWQGNVYWTSGLWETALSRSTSHYDSRYDKYAYYMYVSNENEKYLTYSKIGNLAVAKVSIGSIGAIEITDKYTPSPYPSLLSYCSFFKSKDEDQGCVMQTLPKCRKDDLQFLGKRGIVLGSAYKYDQNKNMGLVDCEAKCRQNCSCIGFASINNNGTGCEIYDKDISFLPLESRNTQSFPFDERMVYLIEHRATQWWIGLIDAAGGTFLLMSIFCCYMRRYFKRKQKQAEKMLLYELADIDIPTSGYGNAIGRNRIGKRMNRVHLFSFESLEVATNNFCAENKLGEGGFGSVYKGQLPSGPEIAIKRLSRSSGQGLLEFKNEILLIAKLQHDNLVKILGCCIQRQEKILVYEYMPNRSLDFFLFDPSRRKLIKWINRVNIIEGVAQGLLYLHKYSRLRVIHRDLKASNILLDENMNPKISDFGMARIFGKQDSEANTKRIVGTHGYMSPEYAIRGVFSIKSDVFSFGVLLLEIVSGKKNRGCYHSERPLNLIGLAWELWIEGRAIELVDPTLGESSHENEILRCINIGLLCVQDNATDRPSMTDVITMLTNESLPLPQPKQPAFFIEIETSTQKGETEVDIEKPCTNDLSISVMDGR